MAKPRRRQIASSRRSQHAPSPSPVPQVVPNLDDSVMFTLNPPCHNHELPPWLQNITVRPALLVDKFTSPGKTLLCLSTRYDWDAVYSVLKEHRLLETAVLPDDNYVYFKEVQIVDGVYIVPYMYYMSTERRNWVYWRPSTRSWYDGPSLGLLETPYYSQPVEPLARAHDHVQIQEDAVYCENHESATEAHEPDSAQNPASSKASSSSGRRGLDDQEESQEGQPPLKRPRMSFIEGAAGNPPLDTVRVQQEAAYEAAMVRFDYMRRCKPDAEFQWWRKNKLVARVGWDLWDIPRGDKRKSVLLKETLRAARRRAPREPLPAAFLVPPFCLTVEEKKKEVEYNDEDWLDLSNCVDA